MPAFPPLPRGRYLYVGSAHGPGGIRARARRHLRTDKPVHWHVDRLTNAFGVALVIAMPGGSECDLLARARALPGAGIPAPGFGSTDCPTCPAHLVSLPDGGDSTALPAVLGGKVVTGLLGTGNLDHL